MRVKLGLALSNTCKCLVSPHKSFKNGDYLRTSLFLIILTVYLFTLGGSLFSYGLTNKPELKKFSENMIRIQIEKSMAASSQDHIDKTVNDAIARQNDPITRAIGFIWLFFSSAIILLKIVFFWLAQVIILKFLGGEEDPLTVQKKKRIKVFAHRRSLVLAAIIFIPSALHAFIAMGINFFRDPNSFLNVLSMEDMIEQFTIMISIYGVFFSQFDLPVIVGNMLNDLTGPFFWWFIIICWFGLEKVWHLSKKNRVIFLVIWFVIYQLFNWGLANASGAFFK